MKHSNEALSTAINLAGTQTKLGIHIGVSSSQISAWLNKENINMPLKYGKKIEEWSSKLVTCKDLFPTYNNDETIAYDKLDESDKLSQIESLIYLAKSQNLDIIVNVSLKVKEPTPNLDLTLAH